MATALVSRRALTARERGRKGGIATAKNSTPEFLAARSTKAGNATKDKYGIDFYSYLQALGNHSTKQRIKAVLQKVVPSIELPETNNTVQLMDAAVKAIGV